MENSGISGLQDLERQGLLPDTVFYRIVSGVYFVTENGAKKQMEQQHKRRVRYAGTHPRKFSEKYKELNPEKYADTVARVISKGSTPAGMHIPVMVEEILDFLQIRPGQRGLDATLGYGGHAGRMLQCLNGQGHLYALDADPIESVKTKERLGRQGYGEDILTVRLMNFSEVDRLVSEVGQFDFVLADLGLSSMQIDNPERGFSFKADGPLDLRLDPLKGLSAAQRLKEVDRYELQGMLTENADEPYAEEIAGRIISALRRGKKVETTGQLKGIIEETLAFLPERERKEAVKKSCQRTFQALRIDVNQEYEVLEAFMDKLPDALAPGGRAAVLTFHSGEDRIVKKAFQRFFREGSYEAAARDVIRPSAAECAANSRAHSTKLRWAVKCGKNF